MHELLYVVVCPGCKCSLEISDKLKNLMIGLMIDKENEESSENYDLEEDNQILITQEISSEESSLEEESDNQKDCDGICACSYKSINVISKYSKPPFNLIIRNYVSLINSIYFQFWYDKDKTIRYLFYSSIEILKFEFPL